MKKILLLGIVILLGLSGCSQMKRVYGFGIGEEELVYDETIWTETINIEEMYAEILGNALTLTVTQIDSSNVYMSIDPALNTEFVKALEERTYTQYSGEDNISGNFTIRIKNANSEWFEYTLNGQFKDNHLSEGDITISPVYQLDNDESLLELIEILMQSVS